MKNSILTVAAFFAFAYASAQTNTKNAVPQPDTIAIPASQGKKFEKPLEEIKRETDVKNMDAVKTKDHQKTTSKNRTVKKDTAAVPPRRAKP